MQRTQRRHRESLPIRLAYFQPFRNNVLMNTKPSRITLLRSALCGATIAMFLILPFASAEAKWLNKTRPELPLGVFFQGLEGSVVLSLVMDKSGHVTDTRILRSSGHSALDQLAIDAAMSWRLSPDSVLSSDMTQGRVELISFRNHPVPAQLLPGSHILK